CWLSPKLSTVAACVYILIPIHLNHLYTSFNIYAEFAAASLLAFCLGYLTRIFQRDKWTDALGLGICYALLILTHLPFTIISSICMAVYALLLFSKKDGIKPFLKCFVGAIIGFAASSFYWVAMISEMQWLKHASEDYSKGVFDYQTGFFPFAYYRVSDTSHGSWIFDVSTILTLLFLISSAAYFIYRSKNKLESDSENSVFRTVLPLGLFAFFMVTPLSSWIWKIITPLQKIQFPVRWLPVTAMCGAVVVVVSAQYFFKAGLHKNRLWIYASGISIAAVVLFNALYILHPTAFVPISGERFNNYAITSPDSESYHFWWTIWSKNEAFQNTDKLSAGDRSSKIITWEAENRVFEVFDGSTENVRVATFYYPHWQATVNDQPVEIGKDENGAMIIPVGYGKSTVRLHFQEPFSVRTASILSILTWLGLLSLILLAARKKFFSTENLSAKFLEKEFST
ncbi:MAG TPA: 6-pyruvoyl-tetrahydropterin synthase-related protein, partial [Pyrinomonadaceae bacterium]|nr:6-pyruvoyl-tetrahydropterin synthase-related protein [Pyrinomonadaceae bacterium]